MQQKAVEAVGSVPFILLLNKSDLADRWEIDEQVFFRMVEQGWRVIRTSAKTGDGVEQAFEALARAMLARAPAGPAIG